MKTISILAAGVLIGISSSAYAATFTVDPSASLLATCKQILGIQAPAPTPTPAPTPSPAPVTTGDEKRFTAYTTGYGWPDNTPPGNEVSHGVLHNGAGGDGSYNNPITLAVGHSITAGRDTLDFAAGTRFYIPNLRRYFIVEDSCGDGNSPQNGPCHTGYQGHVWLDQWIGGQGLSKSGTLSCEDTVTGLHLVIQNPSPNYVVVTGPVYNGQCSPQFGDTVLLK